MDAVLFFLAVVSSLACLAVVSWTHGVDTRPGFEDPRAPARDISV